MPDHRRSASQDHRTTAILGGETLGGKCVFFFFPMLKYFSSVMSGDNYKEAICRPRCFPVVTLVGFEQFNMSRHKFEPEQPVSLNN